MRLSLERNNNEDLSIDRRQTTRRDQRHQISNLLELEFHTFSESLLMLKCHEVSSGPYDFK